MNTSSSTLRLLHGMLTPQRSYSSTKHRLLHATTTPQSENSSTLRLLFHTRITPPHYRILHATTPPPNRSHLKVRLWGIQKTDKGGGEWYRLANGDNRQFRINQISPVMSSEGCWLAMPTPPTNVSPCLASSALIRYIRINAER
ncbi:hypothetical protein GDO81_024042 [Engystomops pustulosus]|uniref:Uncharacterized protein n=1 Tax=Engystomops pustulosus TaxID=76066 RepID=A0AAV6ZNE1_ENGPU|nr:hypothetical protein GDO81_024042 [Engystomops pustulosus]